MASGLVPTTARTLKPVLMCVYGHCGQRTGLSVRQYIAPWFVDSFIFSASIPVERRRIAKALGRSQRIATNNGNNLTGSAHNHPKGFTFHVSADIGM